MSNFFRSRFLPSIRVRSSLNRHSLSRDLTLGETMKNDYYTTVIFLRHGQSTWNQQNIFIGMTDTPLTNDGIEEAKMAGRLLSNEDVQFDMIYTSLLRRSIKTAWMVLQELGLEWIPVKKDWRLNERSYGALVGRNKKECVIEYGKDQVKAWRRSWDTPPPPMSKDSQYWPGKDERYTLLGLQDQLPLSESLKDVTKRTSVFWDDVIVPMLRSKKRILIVGHENNLRSIIKRLDDISDKDIINLELPRAIPLVYKLDPMTLKPVRDKKNDQVYRGLGVKADYLSGRYICDPAMLKEIAKRDQRQVYDLRVKETLEKVRHDSDSNSGSVNSDIGSDLHKNSDSGDQKIETKVEFKVEIDVVRNHDRQLIPYVEGHRVSTPPPPVVNPYGNVAVKQLHA